MSGTPETERFTLSIPQAAQALGMRYRDAYDLLLTGALEGTQWAGRWRVTPESVARIRHARDSQLQPTP